METPKNTRPGAQSGTMQAFDADPLEDETVETPTQDDAGEGSLDRARAASTDDSAPEVELDLSGEAETVETETQADAGDGGVDDRREDDESGQAYEQDPSAQTLTPDAVAPTSQVGDQNPASDGPADDSADGDPQNGPEAGSDGDSAPSGGDSGSDAGQNNANSSSDSSGT